MKQRWVIANRKADGSTDIPPGIEITDSYVLGTKVLVKVTLHGMQFLQMKAHPTAVTMPHDGMPATALSTAQQSAISGTIKPGAQPLAAASGATVLHQLAALVQSHGVEPFEP